MDTEAQKRAIIEKLTGAPAGTLPPDDVLDEPWRTLYRRLTPAKNLLEATLHLWEATADLEDAHTLALELFDLLPGDDAFTPFSRLPEPPATSPTPQEVSPNTPSNEAALVPYPSLHEMSAQFPPVDWLWPAWIPRGMVTLLAAAPGAGKSLVALDLARRVIHGGTFPDGAPVPDPGRNVLIVDADGDPALITQRARAWDIDLRRLYLMRAPSRSTLIDLYRPEQVHLLARMVIKLRPVLVIVDSLASATSRAETSIQGARALLGGLSPLAREARLALLVIHHLRKSARSGGSAPSQVAADDLRGSSHLSAVARSVLTLTLLNSQSAAVPQVVQRTEGSPTLGRPDSPQSTTPQGTNPHRPPVSPNPQSQVQDLKRTSLRRLEVVKTNLCRLPPPLALLFEGENTEVPTLRYTEYTEPPAPPTQLDLCARWLLNFITAARAPVKPADAIRAAAEEGFPRQTLYRARRALASTIVDLGNSPHDPHKRWTLTPKPSSTEGTHQESGTVVH